MSARLSLSISMPAAQLSRWDSTDMVTSNEVMEMLAVFGTTLNMTTFGRMQCGK